MRSFIAFSLGVTCLLGSFVHASERVILRADFDSPFNNVATLQLKFVRGHERPTQDLRVWMNCLPPEIANPDFEIRIQNLNDPKSDPVAYKVLGSSEKSEAETCDLMRRHLEANANNQVEVLLDEERGTASLLNLLRKDAYKDL